MSRDGFEGHSPDRGVVVVDYGMGNLYSVVRACERLHIPVAVSADPQAVAEADAVILPGVGAFGDAMRNLSAAGLDQALQHAAAQGTPVLGICLGLQLLMGESHEFGVHRGLALVPGTVERLQERVPAARRLKVPQVGWNEVREAQPGAWRDTLLAPVPDGSAMYFVHSYHVRPESAANVLAVSTYGDEQFCSAVRHGSVFGCQFHPELSGEEGLSIIRHFAARAGYAAVTSVLES